MPRHDAAWLKLGVSESEVDQKDVAVAVELPFLLVVQLVEGE